MDDVATWGFVCTALAIACIRIDVRRFSLSLAISALVLLHLPLRAAPPPPMPPPPTSALHLSVSARKTAAATAEDEREKVPNPRYHETEATLHPATTSPSLAASQRRPQHLTPQQLYQKSRETLKEWARDAGLL